MTISPLHGTVLQPSDALTLDAPQPSAPVEQQAAPQAGSGEDILARDAWGDDIGGNDISGNDISGNDISGNDISGNDISVDDTGRAASRTFGVQLDTNYVTQSVPTPDALDRIAAHVLSFIT